jgi:cytoskeletal protein CcmA (bactofilin family)
MAFNTGKGNMKTNVSETHSSNDPDARSFLGKTLKIEGELTSDEYLTIEGKVKGNVNVSKTLTIGKNGHVNGEINAKEVKIVGRAEGNINATDRLEISSSGNFSGNLKSNKLIIEEGAIFKGKANLEE